MKITDLINVIANHNRAITDILLKPIVTSKPHVWMMDSTPDEQLASRSSQIADHASRIMALNEAIHAQATGKILPATTKSPNLTHTEN